MLGHKCIHPLSHSLIKEVVLKSYPIYVWPLPFVEFLVARVMAEVVLGRKGINSGKIAAVLGNHALLRFLACSLKCEHASPF